LEYVGVWIGVKITQIDLPYSLRYVYARLVFYKEKTKTFLKSYLTKKVRPQIIKNF